MTGLSQLDYAFFEKGHDPQSNFDNMSRLSRSQIIKHRRGNII